MHYLTPSAPTRKKEVHASIVQGSQITSPSFLQLALIQRCCWWFWVGLRSGGFYCTCARSAHTAHKFCQVLHMSVAVKGAGRKISRMYFSALIPTSTGAGGPGLFIIFCSCTILGAHVAEHPPLDLFNNFSFFGFFGNTRLDACSADVIEL